jgi:hypothetical protein
VYTLDTNVIIYYLKQNDPAADSLYTVFSSQSPVYLSAMSELELLSLPSLRQDEFLSIGRFINRLITIPLDSRTARVAATIRRRVPIKSPDAAIAATAIITGTTLITRNVRDFANVPNLSVQPI